MRRPRVEAGLARDAVVADAFARVAVHGHQTAQRLLLQPPELVVGADQVPAEASDVRTAGVSHIA